MLRAGLLDRSVEIQVAAESAGTAGEVSRVWSMVTKVWAQVIPMPGREVFRSDRDVAVRTARFIMRYVDGITAKHRLVYAGDYWNVLSVGEIGRKEGLEILAEVVE